jgi:predicted GNAT family N-acyltransferase
MIYNLTLTEQLLRSTASTYGEFSNDTWEVGRLVLAPEYRSGQDVLKRCLYLTLRQLCENREVGHLYASCSHILSRLYRRFGFSVCEKDVHLQGTEKVYNLIHGLPNTVLAALKSDDMLS